jgi:hypothetical protein
VENAGLVEPINQAYQDVWGPLHNFFLPSMELVPYIPIDLTMLKCRGFFVHAVHNDRLLIERMSL